MNNNILILDKSKFEREKIKYILNSIGGFTTSESESFDGAKIYLINNEYSIIILESDFSSNYSNYDILNFIRKNKLSKNTPLIITSKTNNLMDKKKSLEFNISDYIIKPFTIQRLENTINSILKIDKIFTYEVKENNKIIMTFDDYIAKQLKLCSRANQSLSIIFTTSIKSIKLFDAEENNTTDSSKNFFSVAADKIRKNLRDTDTVILNNNDILTILPFTTNKNANTVYNKSKKSIQDYLKKLNTEYDNHFYSVIVSFPDDGIDFQSLMEVVSKKISDKKLLEKIVSIPLASNKMVYSKNNYSKFKNYLKYHKYDNYDN